MWKQPLSFKKLAAVLYLLLVNLLVSRNHTNISIVDLHKRSDIKVDLSELGGGKWIRIYCMYVWHMCAIFT